MSQENNVVTPAVVEAKTIVIPPTKQEKAAMAILKDETIQVDATFKKLVVDFEKIAIKAGSKYADMIRYISANYSPDDKEARKPGYNRVLKTLLDMGKTVSSAYSTTSRLFTLAKIENIGCLDLLAAGEMTVRDTRKIGAKGGRPEGNDTGSQEAEVTKASLEERFNKAIAMAVGYGFDLKLTGEQMIEALSKKIADKQAIVDTKAAVAAASAK
jgi:hypothetical protein